MLESLSRFMRLALSGEVVKSAIKVALIVGTLLALINHGDSLLQMSLNAENIVQILLTYLVPYCVATYLSVKAIQAYFNQDS